MLSHHHAHPYIVQDVAFAFSLIPALALLLLATMRRAGPPGLRVR